MELNPFTVFEILGVAAFAISGALSAMDRRMDLFGIFIIAFVTATGGGTIRDLLIDAEAVFWMERTTYIYMIGGFTILAITFRNRLYFLKKSLFLFDTIGLGVFTITGVEAGIHSGLDPVVSIALGALTGAFGGVIRDILCNEIPVIFRKENLYATPCLLGGFIFILMRNQKFHIDVIYMVTSLTVIAIRLLAVKYHITLPTFYAGKDAKTLENLKQR